MDNLGLAFDGSDELAAMLVDSAQNFLSARHSLKRVRAFDGDAVGLDRAIWSEMAELGWLGLCAPEERGGAGLGLGAAVLLARAFGYAMLSEPFVQAAILPVMTLAALEGSPAKALTQAVIDGSRIMALTWQERPGQIAPGPVATQLSGAGSGLIVSGVKSFVPWAAACDVFLVVAMQRDDVALVTVKGSDARILTAAAVDGSPLATVDFAEAPCELVASGVSAEQAVSRALTAARIVLAGEIVGLTSAALGLTADFLRTRVQFGKPIGSYQALQHRLVDHYNLVRLADASVSAAAQAFDAGAGDIETRASAAKARASQVGETVTAGAIQFHGAIGYTEEHDIGLYLKGALRRAAALGNASAHAKRAAALLLPGIGA